MNIFKKNSAKDGLQMFMRHLFFKFFLFVLMTLIASIITFSKKKNWKTNVTLDPRHGTLALDMEPSTLDKKTHTLDFMSRNAKAWKFNLLYHNKKNPVELKHCETSSSCRVFYLMKLKPEKEMYYFFLEYDYVT